MIRPTVALALIAALGLLAPHVSFRRAKLAGPSPAFALRASNAGQPETSTHRALAHAVGLEELTPGAKALDETLRRTVDELMATWPANVRRYYQNLDDPAVRFAVHLGARVRGSSSPPALTYLYNEVAPLPGIRLVSIPLDTAPGALAERLTQIVAHPRVVLVTSTEPHKPAVAQWMKTHASGVPDARVRMIPSSNNAWLHRAADGTVARAVLSNSDGPSFVTQYQRVWGRHDGQDGTFRGQRVIILGGWGGLSQAVVISVLQEHPASLVISEKVNVSNARQELPRIAATLGIDSSHVAVFGPQEPGLNDALRIADVVVNATGIGQDEHDARSPIADGAVFERPAGQRVVAIDSIYRTHAGAPRPVTPFLQQAWTYGVRDVYNGVGLYVRDFAWEAAWITEQVTGTSLDESRQEAIYQQVYRWARETRGLREAREVLEAGGLEETARAEEVDTVLTPLFEPMRPAVIRAITGPIMVCIAPSLLDLSQLSEPELVEQFAILERRLLASFGNDLRVTVTLNVHEAAEAEARGIAVFRLVRTKSRHEPKSWGIVVTELPLRQRLELAALVPLVVRGLSHAPRGVEQVPADPYLELGVTLPEALDALERYL